jgi:hypothetical protein
MGDNAQDSSGNGCGVAWQSLIDQLHSMKVIVLFVGCSFMFHCILLFHLEVLRTHR